MNQGTQSLVNAVRSDVTDLNLFLISLTDLSVQQKADELINKLTRIELILQGIKLDF